METSSPLAALHRPMPAPIWGGRDMFRSHSHGLFPASGSGSGHMSLRERLHKNPGDYFNVKDVRGSSPAASLAADLSQNFRLDNDASPQFPTPRRALFTASVMGGMDGRDYVTTPPLPASSPAGLTELMEVSPLPHKTPFSSQIEVTSPTPISTPTVDEEDDDDDMMLDSPAPIPRQSSLELPRSSSMADRKIAAPRRPSLTRMKNLTTSAVMTRGQPELQSQPQLEPFRFGGDSEFCLSNQNNLSPGQCFDTASPPPERRPQSANSPSSPVPFGIRPRSQFSSASNMGGHRLGSPMNFQPRRSSNPFLRNRKQFRRSLSMFENPGDIMRPKSDADEPGPSALRSVMDVEEVQEPQLPHFMADDPVDTIPRISRETLLEVLDGRYAESFDQKMVIDCRFEYEYEGGHIDGAVNYNDKELLANQLFQSPMGSRTLLIFHCEYSVHRAPLMARHVRSEDRTTNAEYYPRLTYPEVYILDGGYSGFFSEHRARCFPPAYVEMSDENHQRTCEREMGRLKSRKGLGRAQTFAFGQRSSCVENSPTASARPGSRQDPMALIGNSPVLGDRVQTRRMASY